MLYFAPVWQVMLLGNVPFLPRDAAARYVLAMAQCLSVRLSVQHTRRYCIETTRRIELRLAPLPAFNFHEDAAFHILSTCFNFHKVV